MDAAWTYADVDAAAEFIAAIPDVGLGWFEDVFPPGDAGRLARLRRRIDIPIAQGDEQGGSYYPEALILAKARPLTVTAVTDCEALFVPRHAFMKLVQQSPELAQRAVAKIEQDLGDYLGALEPARRKMKGGES